MEKGMEQYTLLLEQYRAELDALAGQGSGAVAEAVEQAKKHAYACEQEWQQARKTVELTANQQQAVEDACKTGKEKLALAVS